MKEPDDAFLRPSRNRMRNFVGEMAGNYIIGMFPSVYFNGADSIAKVSDSKEYLHRKALKMVPVKIETT